MALTTVGALALIAPAVVAVDKAIQLSRQRKTRTTQSAEPDTRPVIQAST